MSAPKMFADHFAVQETEWTVRHASPVAPRRVGATKSMTLPFELGRALMDIYTDGQHVYGRLYHVESGSFAWYDITVPRAAILGSAEQ